MTPKHGDLKVWWIPQVPMKAFEVRVATLAEARLLLDVLADYDRFQFENNVKPDYANAGDVAVFEGSERRFVGKSEIREEEREYRISMRWDQGRPWVVGLSAAHLDRSRQDSQSDPAKG